MGQTAYTALTDIDTAIYVSESLPTNNFGNADLTINTDGASYDHDGDGSPSNPSNDERVGLTKFTIQQPSFYGVPDDATLVVMLLNIKYSGLNLHLFLQ
jgi:hypothetical protein